LQPFFELTAKYDDIVAKASQGTILFSIATWPFLLANGELLKQGPDKGTSRSRWIGVCLG
jgi:hypothetical protein